MSEYQYYEFQKIDGRLTEIEMRELRSCSSRAEITPASFTNEYHFGDFKGNANAWMEKYFDAYLYLANWGTHEVQFVLPAGLLPLKTAKQYCSNHAASCREKSGKLIVAFLSEEEGDGDWLEGDGLLSPLLAIREELAQGDLRGLYLGWLAGVPTGEVKESALEPPVPPNLDKLSRPQSRLADFLRVDPDLLAVAAQNSPRVQPDVAGDEAMATWIAALPATEKDGLLVQVMQGNASRLGLELQARFRQQKPTRPATPGPKPRTAAELLSAAEGFREEQPKRISRKPRPT